MESFKTRKNWHYLLGAPLPKVTKKTSARGPRSYLLIDVGYRVHPAANAHLIPHIGRVTKLMDDADVVGIGTAEQFLFQSQCVHLWKDIIKRSLEKESKS